LAGLKIMMGHRQVEQAALFYEFSLEKPAKAGARVIATIYCNSFSTESAKS
jgi:hypothetical protein